MNGEQTSQLMSQYSLGSLTMNLIAPELNIKCS
jgi:hypothetical protein